MDMSACRRSDVDVTRRRRDDGTPRPVNMTSNDGNQHEPSDSGVNVSVPIELGTNLDCHHDKRHCVYFPTNQNKLDLKSNHSQQKDADSCFQLTAAAAGSYKHRQELTGAQSEQSFTSSKTDCIHAPKTDGVGRKTCSFADIADNSNVPTSVCYASHVSQQASVEATTSAAPRTSGDRSTHAALTSVQVDVNTASLTLRRSKSDWTLLRSTVVTSSGSDSSDASSRKSHEYFADVSRQSINSLDLRVDSRNLSLRRNFFKRKFRAGLELSIFGGSSSSTEDVDARSRAPLCRAVSDQHQTSSNDVDVRTNRDDLYLSDVPDRRWERPQSEQLALKAKLKQLRAARVTSPLVNRVNRPAQTAADGFAKDTLSGLADTRTESSDSMTANIPSCEFSSGC